MGRQGGGRALHHPRVGHDGLGEAGDDVAGVGVGQDLGLGHEAGDINLTGAETQTMKTTLTPVSSSCSLPSV